jgi:leader peptidase (prepilin peptidase) / N-methyltransferase
VTWLLAGTLGTLGLAAGPAQRAAVLRYARSEPVVTPAACGLVTAVALAVLALRLSSGVALALASWLVLVGVPLVWIDADVRRLPNALTGLAYVGTLLLLTIAGAGTGHWDRSLQALCAGLALGGFYLALCVLLPRGMGVGDAKLGGSFGTLLGWFGWSAVIDGTFIAFLLAAMYGAGMLLARRVRPRRSIPFGPFMTIAALTVMLFTAG